MRKIKIKSILAVVAGLFLATSCSSSFLDTDPTDAVSSEKVPVPENAEALVNGAWYNLFDYSSTYANIGYRALQCLDDMMASDIVSRPKYGFNSSYQFNDIALPSNNRTEFAWYLIYKTIDNCNTAISIQGDSEELRQAQGQALALRAFCYLHLVLYLMKCRRQKSIAGRRVVALKNEILWDIGSLTSRTVNRLQQIAPIICMLSPRKK